MAVAEPTTETRLITDEEFARMTVFAYRSLTDVREFTSADELPGFSVAVASLFED